MHFNQHFQASVKAHFDPPTYISKAQGQTFERVGVLLVDSVFGHGQLYVAFSRTRSFQNLFVVLPTKKTSTKNVVYDEVLTALHPASSQDTA